MSFQPQAHPDPPCLRFPENLGLHAAVNIEAAVNMLLRAVQMSQNVPYMWTFIDKPAEGQLFLLYLQNPAQFPNDGIRYQDQESRYVIPAGNREMEVSEIKHGFVPNSPDTTAWRLRRRYRLHRGGHPQLVLVHYTRGPPIQIVPSLLNSPVRQYPLRQITEPSVYIMGDKAGQKVYPPGSAPPPPPQAPMGMPPHPMSMNQQGVNPPVVSINAPGMGMNAQAMLAQQNSVMEALERRRERERPRERGGSMSGSRPGPPRLDDDDSADETETISTRTLAITRYRRNHELMEEVFKQAAFGNVKRPAPQTAYSIFDKSELEAKVNKLQEEVDALRAKAVERKTRLVSEDVIAVNAPSPMEIAP
ncbi:hypothetical protein F5J12DRAFT_966070 [Pisolithus orientalis]|uniref:uncharacterized protein n=1 Tax=Pisolithus orientalis TaxID=936130 RepID=UPI002224E404|nr:uncharacterized protein F5J12DRAFT_966070 [Pisolithus orientalis]KAI5991702.1 hypothetical protein F5J12DRAFT_966070 [Pisolithus orientalis]